MIIAFLTHEPFFPPSGGGSAEAVYLVEEMVSRGHQVHLFCPRVEDPNLVRSRFKVHLLEFTKFEMGRYTSLRTPKYLIYPSFLQRMVKQAGRNIHFDCILSQHAVSAVAAGRLKRELGVPVIMNFLDYLTGFMETWPAFLAPPPALALLKRFELNMPRKYAVDGVLTVSDTLADHFAGTGYPTNRIQPIYYGYDSSLFPFREPRLPPAEGPFQIVMHGSLDHHHLGDVGLVALRAVLTQLPKAQFKLVGHRTDAVKKFISRLTQQVPSARVECTGFVPYSEVAKYLHQAHVGIVPYEESTGTHCAFVAKIVEYLATGLPVVSTKLNSAFRYFQNEPMVKFTPFDGESFGQAILETLRHPLSNLSHAAYQASQRVQRELDWRAISRKAIDFLESRVREAHSL